MSQTELVRELEGFAFGRKMPMGSKSYQTQKATSEDVALIALAGSTGLEPATSDVTGRRSNQTELTPQAVVRVCFRSRALRGLVYTEVCPARNNFFEKIFGIKSLLIVLAVIVVVFFVIKFLLSRYKRKRSVESFCYDVEIDVNGAKTMCKGFLDSGNLLYDPLSEKPVSLVNFKVFSSIFKQIELSDVLMKTKKIKEIKFAHFINFKTLNFDSQILVFEIDKMAVGDKIFENVMLGLSLQNFNQAFGSDMILHNNIA